ncbi:L-lactate dehydrogenase [Massilimicrobiota sp. An142]|jgi:L-lactate dehydrogenase|uniref:L-lactate dehydrogenase n=1 Tax=Massilimicrobiota timonensis TaxID=1776392 RepID=A0ABT7UJW4_9FIRM|nr:MULTISPECIES: L-lactate dehydrogenase [Massilimicrobiota]MEE0778951.1 L-lactate dehydrogenase [Massilimicrobiota sp.]MDM8196445.1 L-lactate dehydrogenase [Massilimicrobiota timonensis]OUN35445.1 L-lactate dehydrogenase [Massilimicrobiota sp. An80]OUQ13574.1 L-lactate dehydrogenase [Massilimicrobiota sp. An142]OUQ27226.1 L-lactate dehydrogenase [Massilimicrobiota sp. An134]
MVNMQKVAVIGCGFVGATSAFSLIQTGLFSEMVLIDANAKKAEGEAMDLSHGSAYLTPMNIYAGTYDDIVDAGIIVITAGANQKPDETRLDLVKKNVQIFKSIIPEIKKRNCEGILLIVSNPVDILTEVALKLSGFPSNRVIGSGTVLDTARLKYVLGKHLQVDPRDIHAYIIGEHGDSELVVWSGAQVAGIHINHFCELRGHFNHEEAMERLAQEVRDSAYEIIERKGATYYGVAVAVKRIATAIVKDEHAVLPVSSLMQGEFGLNDLCLSIPTVIGQNGVEKVVDIYLNNDENDKLQSSARALKEVLDDLDL